MNLCLQILLTLLLVFFVFGIIFTTFGCNDLYLTCFDYIPSKKTIQDIQIIYNNGIAKKCTYQVFRNGQTVCYKFEYYNYSYYSYNLLFDSCIYSSMIKY